MNQRQRLKHPLREHSLPSRLHGLGLISAIFFITVAATLTVAIARSLNTTAAAAGLEISTLNAV